MKNKIYLVFLSLLIFTTKLNGQCAMCKAAVEANLNLIETFQKKINLKISTLYKQ